MVSSVSLESLPEDLLRHICSHVAGDADAVKNLFNLRLVSKKFHRLAKEPFLLRGVSFLKMPLSPWFLSEESHREFTRFVHDCAAAGNPAAKYRVGVVQYFLHDGEAGEQMETLQRIADAGDKEAQFFYGSILVCLGGETKSKGFQILTPLRIPLVYTWPYSWMDLGWLQHIDELKWLGAPMVQHLKRSYVREKCTCGGVKDGLYENPGTYWDRFDRFLFHKKLSDHPNGRYYMNAFTRTMFEAGYRTKRVAPPAYFLESL